MSDGWSEEEEEDPVERRLRLLEEKQRELEKKLARANHVNKKLQQLVKKESVHTDDVEAVKTPRSTRRWFKFGRKDDKKSEDAHDAAEADERTRGQGVAPEPGLQINVDNDDVDPDLTAAEGFGESVALTSEPPTTDFEDTDAGPHAKPPEVPLLSLPKPGDQETGEPVPEDGDKSAAVVDPDTAQETAQDEEEVEASARPVLTKEHLLQLEDSDEENVIDPADLPSADDDSSIESEALDDAVARGFQRTASHRSAGDKSAAESVESKKDVYDRIVQHRKELRRKSIAPGAAADEPSGDELSSSEDSDGETIASKTFAYVPTFDRELTIRPGKHPPGEERVELQMMEEVDDKYDRDPCFGLGVDGHRCYQWLCWPYWDHWFPWPSKPVLHKTLTRIDHNSFNPFEAFHDYYLPYWSYIGCLLTLGLLALMGLFTWFSIDISNRNLWLMEDTFRPAYTSIDGYSPRWEVDGHTLLPAAHLGVAFYDSSNTAFFDSSYFSVRMLQVTRIYSRNGDLASSFPLDYGLTLTNETTTELLNTNCTVLDLDARCPTTNLTLDLKRSSTVSVEQFVRLEIQLCNGLNGDLSLSPACVYQPQSTTTTIPCASNSTCFVTDSKLCAYSELEAPGATNVSSPSFASYTCRNRPTSCSSNATHNCYQCNTMIATGTNSYYNCSNSNVSSTIQNCRFNPATNSFCNATLLPVGVNCTETSPDSTCILEELCNHAVAEPTRINETYQYANCTLETKCQTACQNSAIQESKLSNGKFAFLYNMQSPENVSVLFPLGLLDPAFNTLRVFPYPTSPRSVHASILFQRQTQLLKANSLRDDKRVNWLKFHGVEQTIEEARTNDVVLNVDIKLDNFAKQEKLLGYTELDTAAQVGGMLILCKVFVAIFSTYFVMNTFNQTKRFHVDSDVVKTLLRLKAKNLDYYKEKLTDMQANEVMRIDLDDLYVYLNHRRDTELATFRWAMFKSLNTKPRKTARTRPEEEAVLSAMDVAVEHDIKEQRTDVLQLLIRHDEEPSNPDLCRILNVLTLEELKRQTLVLSEFVMLRHQAQTQNGADEW